MITPNIEPTTKNSTNAIATFTQRTLIAIRTDGLIFDAQEQSGDSELTEDMTKHTSVARKNGRYIKRRLTSPKDSYLAISAQE